MLVLNIKQCLSYDFLLLHVPFLQSNSASAVITAELAAAQRSLLDAQQRLGESEEALAVASSKCESLEYVLFLVPQSVVSKLDIINSSN